MQFKLITKLVLAFVAISFTTNVHAQWSPNTENINDPIGRNGNVGIGTLTPSEKLEVTGRILSGNTLIGTDFIFPEFAFFGNNDLNQGSAANYALKQSGIDGRTIVNSPLRVDLAIANIARVTLSENGNLGIGTVTPSEKLEVLGSVKAGFATIGTSKIPAFPSNPNRFATFGNNLLNQTQSINYALMQNSTGETYLNSPEQIDFRIMNSTKMTLADNGFVGIGTTNPSHRLHINSDGGWQMRLNNSGPDGDDWYIGSSNSEWTAGAGKFLISPVSGSASSALAITSNGNVGVGTVDPQRSLVVGDNAAPIIGLKSPAGRGSKGWAMWENAAGNYAIYEYTNSAWSSGADRFVISRGGNIGIGYAAPSQKLSVNGNVFAAGVYLSSDKRFKEHIKVLPDAMQNLYKINGYSYDIKAKTVGEHELIAGRSLGLIAQEVEKVFPELVFEDAEGYKAVNYIGLIPVLVEALKSQDTKMLTMQEEIISLKAALETKLEENNYIQQPTLFQNRPNPFNGTTEIEYNLPDGVSQALILITDLQGKEISRKPITQFGKGNISINANSLAKGLYLYTLIIDGKPIDTKRMLID